MRRARIAHDRQVLVLDAHERRAARGGEVVLGDDERDAVAVVAHGIIAQHGLVGVDQPVAVVRHVLRGQHRDDARHGQRGRGVDREDARVAAPREDGLQPQHARPDQVGGIVGRAGDFVERVVTRMRGADVVHVPTSTRSGVSTLSAAEATAVRIFA